MPLYIHFLDHLYTLQSKDPSECYNRMHTVKIYQLYKGCFPKIAHNAILLVIDILAMIITIFGSCHIAQTIEAKINYESLTR